MWKKWGQGFRLVIKIKKTKTICVPSIYIIQGASYTTCLLITFYVGLQNGFGSRLVFCSPEQLAKILKPFQIKLNETNIYFSSSNRIQYNTNRNRDQSEYLNEESCHIIWDKSTIVMWHLTTRPQLRKVSQRDQKCPAHHSTVSLFKLKLILH